MESEAKPILCKAAVAYEPKKPMTVEDIWVAPPKEGEVRIKVIANALCHTDIYTLQGYDSEGSFPCVLGHEATGIVESIGKEVTRVAVGDIVIPCYTPQCMSKTCIYCQHQKCNLCPKVRATQGKGLMPDGTSRFTTKDGKTISHFMGCSTFSEYTVIAEISAAKVNPSADLNKVCMIGCGVSTGWGAVMNNTDMQPGQTVAVWGLGAVGLAVVQAANIRGAKKIYAIDINSKKFELAKKFGAHECYQPTSEKNGKSYLLECEKWGIDYTFDCTGNVKIMRQALEAAHRGWGESCVIGVAESGAEIATRPFQLVTGRKWLGTAFGGWKSVEDVPKLVNKAALGQWPIDDYVTHEINNLENVNDAVTALHSGQCLRAIVKISIPPQPQNQPKIKITDSSQHFGGVLHMVTHYSETTHCFMNFGLYLPDSEISKQRGEPYPALYCLAGLTCNHENFPIKSGFGHAAQKHRLALVFPDTSPRNTNIEGIADDWEIGNSAGYYVDATSEKCKKQFKMYTYLTYELPELISTFFPVSKDNMSVTGFSMGGHGAIICGTKSGLYKSISAISPISHPTASERFGIKAYKIFFNNWEEEGKQWDATELAKANKIRNLPLFIEVGSHDQFAELLKVEDLLTELNKHQIKYKYIYRKGYKHNFFYVSSVIAEHIEFHAQYLNSIW